MLFPNECRFYVTTCNLSEDTIVKSLHITVLFMVCVDGLEDLHAIAYDILTAHKFHIG